MFRFVAVLQQRSDEPATCRYGDFRYKLMDHQGPAQRYQSSRVQKANTQAPIRCPGHDDAGKTIQLPKPHGTVLAPNTPVLARGRKGRVPKGLLDCDGWDTAVTRGESPVLGQRDGAP